jgi:transcriptional regulator with XRE-family HTH domain
MDMERLKLRAAREAKGAQRGKSLSQQEVADAIGCSRDAYNMWERGTSDPREYYIGKLCTYYGVTNPRDLDLVPAAQILTLEDIQKMLEIYDRREVIAMLQTLPAFAGVDLLAMLDTPSSSHGEFLGQCNAAISACWQLLQHKGFDAVQEILSTHMPRLIPLATVPDYSDIAAGLAAQAKILQGILAMHRMNFVGRELAMIDAVKYAKVTSDPRIQITTLLYQAYTYVFMVPPRPSKAIPLFLEVLHLAGKSAYLLQSDAYSGLANAYAQDNDQDAALGALRQAEALMPKHPEQDQSFLYADHGWPEFYLWKSRAYLNLTGFSTDYFQQAYDVFVSLDNSIVATTRSASEIAILQADAARGLGDLPKFADHLEHGLHLAIQIDSKMRMSEASDVMGRIPDDWKGETAVQKLRKGLNRALVVARR